MESLDAAAAAAVADDDAGPLLDANDVSLALSMALKKAESASGDLAEALALARLAAESGDSGDGDGGGGCDDAAAAAAEDGGGLADDPDVQDAFLGDAPDYHSKSYWDDRYQKMPEPFDWLQPYKNLRAIIQAVLPPARLRRDARVVVVGCGNADFSAARHDSAEDFCRLKAPCCTAKAWIFIPAYCFAVP